DGGGGAWRLGYRVRDCDRDGSERNLLLPYRLSLFVELQQREERDRLRQAVPVLDCVVEAEAPAPSQEPAQVREALAHGDSRTCDVAGVDLRRGAEKAADRLCQDLRVVRR